MKPNENKPNSNGSLFSHWTPANVTVMNVSRSNPACRARFLDFIDPHSQGGDNEPTAIIYLLLASATNWNKHVCREGKRIGENGPKRRCSRLSTVSIFFLTNSEQTERERRLSSSPITAWVNRGGSEFRSSASVNPGESVSRSSASVNQEE